MSNNHLKVSARKDKSGNYVWKINGVRDFDSRHIFDCGQCFRWREQQDGSWTGITGTKIANVKFEKCEINGVDGESGVLTIKGFAGTTSSRDFSEFWYEYFDLNRDYSELKRKLCRGDRVMKIAVKKGWGIRILNQDLWETIVSFIISQNNNIPRIKGCIERLSEITGEPLCSREIPEGLTPYSIPEPKVLAKLTEEDLAPARLGYRAKYLIETAKTVVNEGLPDNMDELEKLQGVGPKVANCIGLFGLHKYDSFPIDVWVKRIMSKLYGFDENDLNGMTNYAKEHFGELSGFAQQYLFYYIREMA